MIPSYDPTNTEAGLKLLENLTTNADTIQQHVLHQILSQNYGTEYLKSFLDKESDKNQESFKNKVPVVDYEDMKPFIQRIADGDSSHILSSQPIIELLTSSGTSGGKPKLMPSTAEELDRKTFFYNMLVPVMNKFVNGLDEGKGMYLLFVKPEIKTLSGLKARPVLTSYYKSQQFKNRPFNKYNVITSPNETILCEDSKQSMYCQLLCGLVQRSHVLRLGAIFASAFLRAVKFLENHYTQLCADIRTGTVASWITDSSCRESVLSILNGPNSDLADEVEALCSAKSWEGILRRIWPKTKYIEVIVTGSMAQYIPTLDFYSGGLPLVSVMYASSECFFGININPLCKPSDVSYTLLPNMAYFEFLPVDEKSHEKIHSGSYNLKDDQGRIVDLVNVETGRYYELVITTFAGLYRYRVGDILKVTGFHNKAPQFSFVERRNVVLSIDTDKTSEEDLMKAVAQAKPSSFLLTEYTSYADTSSIPGHYVLFWELRPRHKDDPPKLDEKVMEDCCSEVEDCLDYVYRRCRNKDKSIGPLEIRVVSFGTFDSLMDFSISQGSSVNQYKTPRCVKSGGALQILDSRVIGRFFSKREPQWEPLGLDS
ncbi:hypothetical protein CARUB_v10007580mg [Capsella rubella]|uniref:Indole-3-acetic acid-amido synthetase GH3.17-like n=1 Tax=Capsella rubella TaxID=81985 RepID=R0FB38_9BRAS|nr:indole-3-acetic acid-amido synthetase GH3.17 [Capsella rubella]EOA18946.1 hypothetical protein CARUB_v10007580mg [Capsella rubella]